MKTLAVRLSSIGDVVHTLPAAAALRRLGHDVVWLVEPAARVLLEGNPVARPIAAPAARVSRWRAARATLRTLRAARCDLALDFQGLWKSAAWARLSGARRVAGWDRPFRREPASALLLRERVRRAPARTHVIDKNLALLEGLGFETGGTYEFPLPPLDHPAATVAAELARRGVSEFAVLNPGGGWPGKLWPAEHFGALARGLRAQGLTPLVTWGPGEEALADAVVSASDGKAQRAFPTTLLELAALAQRARVFVAADTGPLHLACAVGAPVVGLYGPTDPERNGPFGRGSTVVSRRPACFPCHRRNCATHAGVMRGLPVDEVLAAAVAHRARAAEVARAF